MSVPENADSGANPSLFSSLRSFWSVLIAILYTRLDLASTELEEIGTHAVRLVIISLAALLCLAITFFFLLFFLIVIFWAEKELVIGLVFLFCAITSTVLVLIARKMVYERPKFLAQTLAELRRDVDGLRAAAKTNEVKP